MTFYNVCFVVAFWLEARPKAIFWVQKNIQDKKNGFTKNKWVIVNLLGLNQSLQCDCENEDRLDL